MKVVAKKDGKRDVLLMQESDTLLSLTKHLCQLSQVTDVTVDDVLKNCELSGASMWEVSQVVNAVTGNVPKSVVRRVRL